MCPERGMINTHKHALLKSPLGRGRRDDAHLEIVPVAHESKLGDFIQQTCSIEKCILLEGRHVARVRPFLPELIQIIIFHLDPYWPTARRRSLLFFPHIVDSSGLKDSVPPEVSVAHNLYSSTPLFLHCPPSWIRSEFNPIRKGVPRKDLPSRF